MEDLKLIEQALELATQRGVFNMNDVVIVKKSLDNLKRLFPEIETPIINQTATIQEVVTT